MNYKDLIAKFKPEEEDLTTAFKKAQGQSISESMCSFNPMIKKYLLKNKFNTPMSI